MSETEAVSLHCWEDGPKRLSDDGTRLLTTSCLLERGHAGPHEWTDDDTITVFFNPEEGEGR